MSSPSPEKTARPGFFSALAFPDYRQLWLATATAQSAAWSLIVLRGALVYRMTDSNAWVGFVTMAALLPGLVVTPMAGFLADRFDRRRVLAATYGLNLANNLALAFLTISDNITPGLVLLLAIMNGCIRATEMPTNQALLPNLVPKERLLNAVALNQLMQQGSRMIGPLIILPIINFMGPEPAFAVPVILYGLGWTQILSIRTSSRGVIEQGRGMFSNLSAGILYIYSHPVVFSIIAVTVLHCALTMAFESVFPYFSRAQLGMTTEKDLFQGPTYLMIGVGLGAIVGNLSLARVEDRRIRGRLFLVLGILSGLSPIGLALAGNIVQAMLAVSAVGASTAAFMTLSHGMVQAIVPDGIRGRIVSANTWHVQGAMGGFNAVNGVLMDVSWMTAPILLTATGLIFIGVVLASLLTVSLRGIYSRGISAAQPATGASPAS
jgi:MFS family permease